MVKTDYKDSSINWLKENVMNDPYIQNVWIKKIPDTTNAYSYVFFEPANRGENYVGTGVIGMKTYDCTGASMDKEELLDLFPLRNDNQINSFNEKIEEYQNSLKLLTYDMCEDNIDYYHELNDKSNQLLLELVHYLIHSNGFELLQ